jgi:endogenous inhibitor of DNA gyrase (YacG/DUF329 family)
MTKEVKKEENWKPMNCSSAKCSKAMMVNLNNIPKEFPFCSMHCKTIDLGAFLALAERADEESEPE